MSFTSCSSQIKTVGELKKCLELFPDDVPIMVPVAWDQTNECHPLISFDAEWSDVYGKGDVAKINYDSKDCWPYNLNLSNDIEEPPDYTLEDWLSFFK